jgi:outer membrane protein TolC
LEKTDRLLFDQAHELHIAGVGTNLDELRAHVQWQTQQQQVIASENAHEKSLILLRREIGLAPSQPIALTDTTPYNELALNTPEELRALAYGSRQDYLNLLAQRDEARAAKSGYQHQRWPTLSFKGDYAATAVSGTGTHGNFAAIGTLNFPIFKEAQIRGDVQIASAQLSGVNSQLDDLTHRIDQQVRASLLDVQAAQKLVDVARSNLALATEILSDETDRYKAGIGTNLPVVQAQSSLAAAQSNLVQSELQYNLSKLLLARTTGVIELQYRLYLGK